MKPSTAPERAFLVVLVGTTPQTARPVITTGDDDVLRDVAAVLFKRLHVNIPTPPDLALVKPGDA